MQMAKAPSADEDMPCRCRLQPSFVKHAGNLQVALRTNHRAAARHATHLLPLRSYSGAWIGRHDPPLSKEMRDDACTFLSSPLCASSTLAMYLQCGSYGVRW